MSSTAAVNFRMDTGLKDRFAEICASMGMNISTAFTVFAKTVVRMNAIPFTVQGDPFYNESNLTEIRAALDRLDGGEGVTKTMDELEAMAR